MTMFSIYKRVFLISYILHFTFSVGPGLYKLPSNSYNEWNPSLSSVSSSSSASSSSSSLSSSASLSASSSSALSAVPYSGDTNSYAYWNCHTIPPNMTLCKSVGYSRMVLPNFLQHESLREAIQQANVWIALVNTDCHPDIQRFLCSLYAPVCLKSHQEAKIPPCWELCDQVRNACLPRMKLFGFDWPDIVRCQQFPRLAESMCIPPQEKSTAVTCVPCEQAITLENIASSYCMADVVLKASIKDMILQPNQASIILNLTPRTLALKLIRNDGTQLSSIDQYRRKRNSRRRRNNHDQLYHLRLARDLKVQNNHRSNDRYQSRFSSKSKLMKKVNEDNEWRTDGRTKNQRRRRPRNSRLHDLDGITELVLGCSSCNPLLPFTSRRSAHSLPNQKWLVMGRRIQDSSTKKYTNQLQVTFLGLWNRESGEFRQSLNAIRKEPVAHLCNKNQANLSVAIQPQAIQYNHPGRPLKILRSAPSELSDSPTYEEGENQITSYNSKTHRSLKTPTKQLTSMSNYDMINNHGNADDFPPYPTQTLRKSNYQNISSNFEYLNNLNLEPNSNTRLSDDAQNTYLNEISELQKQNSRKMKRRERKRKEKMQNNRKFTAQNSQIQYDINSYHYKLPINPYSD